MKVSICSIDFHLRRSVFRANNFKLHSISFQKIALADLVVGNLGGDRPEINLSARFLNGHRPHWFPFHHLGQIVDCCIFPLFEVVPQVKRCHSPSRSILVEFLAFEIVVHCFSWLERHWLHCWRGISAQMANSRSLKLVDHFLQFF